MKKEDKKSDISEVIGGTLNILGLTLDLGKLISSPKEVKDRLEELREKLKKAGGKETLTDEEWRQGGASVRGYVKTGGILGEREYHIGTAQPLGKKRDRRKVSEPLEAIEPAVDVFHEAEEVVIVAEVPGVEMADLELRVKDDVFILAAKPAAPRKYLKKIQLGSSVEESSLKATCRNGILEIHLQKKS